MRELYLIKGNIIIILFLLLLGCLMSKYDKSLDRALKNIGTVISNRTGNSNTLADADPLHEISDNSVSKSNALTRAYYRFGLVEKRCMEALISKLNPLRSDNPQEIELLATEYAKAFPDVGKHAYEHLQSAGDALVNRVITVKTPDARVPYVKIPLMAIVQYQPKQGKIICEFNSKIIPHLIGFRENFTSYPLKKAIDFSSSYTWRFYEILASWVDKKKTGGVFAGWIKRQNVDELRDMLGVPESYKWNMFEQRILNVVQTELWEKSNIAVRFTRHKTSRKITSLDIEFIEDEQQQLPLGGAGSVTK